MGLMGGGSPDFSFKLIVVALLVAVLLPMGVMTFAPASYNGTGPDEVLDGYAQFTGQSPDTKVSVWPLVGIYEPFTGGSYDEAAQQTLTYGYTDDGWLYGRSIQNYTPSQYAGTVQDYEVYKDENGVFRYRFDSADYNAEMGTGHRGGFDDDLTPRDYPGDLYTDVSFDVNQMSNIFFTEAGRHDDGGFFWYDYDGYRLAFAPISDYTAYDQDGKEKAIVASKTSLSLVWYQYYTQSGITGQLVLSGSNGGIAYLNAANILSAFNSNTNTAKFSMVFNGVEMSIWIKIDPMATSNNYTVAQCWEMGYWSVMVTSLSVEANAYLGTDSAMNPMKILETVFDILTFNLDDYNVSPWMGGLVSVIYVLPLYAGLIALCLDNAYLWILVGILAAIQAIGSIWPF